VSVEAHLDDNVAEWLAPREGTLRMTAEVARAMGLELKRLNPIAIWVGRFSRRRGVQLGHKIALRHVARWETERDPESAPRQGHEDADAVSELRAIASADRRSLGQAERLSRLGGGHLESAIGNRCYRLIVAAKRDQPIQPPRQIDVARFDATAEFKTLSDGVRWQRLADLVPPLVPLEEEVRHGAFVRPDIQEGTALPRGGRRQRNADAACRWYALQERVGALLGPTSGRTDLLLSSREARNAAFHHLYQLGKSS
jgi:hypothetical protein